MGSLFGRVAGVTLARHSRPRGQSSSLGSLQVEPQTDFWRPAQPCLPLGPLSGPEGSVQSQLPRSLDLIFGVGHLQQLKDKLDYELAWLTAEDLAGAWVAQGVLRCRSTGLCIFASASILKRSL